MHYMQHAGSIFKITIIKYIYYSFLHYKFSGIYFLFSLKDEHCIFII